MVDRRYGGRLRNKLREGDPSERAYWLGALLREGNTRDVCLFTSVAEIKALWPEVQRHLGRSRAMWEFLLDLTPEGVAPDGA